MEEPLIQKLLSGQEFFTEQDAGAVEILRLRVLERVRRENPTALRNPRAHEGYLRTVAHLEAETRVDLIESVVQDILGYGPLQRYIFPERDEDKDVTEIMVTEYNQVYVERRGVLEEAPVRFRNEEHLRTIAQKIVMTCGRRIDESCPEQDAHLPDGSRVHVVIPPLSPLGTTMTIRRFPEPLTMKDLLDGGTLTEEVASFLREAIGRKLNVVITGGMGSGKTTLLNALTSFISEAYGPTASLVCFEDALELQPQHRNVRRFLSRPPGLDGRGGIELADMVKKMLLRLRPDFIILGESRGREAYYVASAMFVGHPAMTTFHADSAVEAALYRFPTMLMMSDEGKSEGRAACLEKTAMALDVVVHCAKVREGSRFERRVVQVAEVLHQETPDGLKPAPKVVFVYRSGRIEQVAEPKVFSKKRREW